MRHSIENIEKGMQFVDKVIIEDALRYDTPLIRGIGNGGTEELTIIRDHVLEKLYSIVEAKGYSKDDFIISETSITPSYPEGIVFAVDGILTITNKKTNTVANYNVLENKDWLDDFKRDLK